jgi:DNA polymerase-3 subunit delta'
MPFRAISGHRALVALLTRAVVRGSLPQSLIFAGPEGVGKRLTAISLAQAVNCPNAAAVAGDEAGDDAPAIDGCGTCSVCRRVAQGMHPDVIQLAATDVGIDDIREAIETAGYRPFEGKRRVFILDTADRLSNEIQNALLKTLEEPPPSSSFVLVTSRPDMLLPTVRSRCPMLRFGRLSVADVERLLEQQHGLERARAHAVAMAAEGSVGRAIVEASDEGESTRQLVQQALAHLQGARSPADRLRAAGMLLEPGEARPKTRVKSGASRYASDRDLLSQRLGIVSGVLRDVAATVTGADQARVTNDLSPALQSWGARAGVDRLTAAFTAVGKAQAALDRNVSPKVILDWLAFQL